LARKSSRPRRNLGVSFCIFFFQQTIPKKNSGASKTARFVCAGKWVRERKSRTLGKLPNLQTNMVVFEINLARHAEKEAQFDLQSCAARVPPSSLG